jgi:polysaccharide export outer membrane protein
MNFQVRVAMGLAGCTALLALAGCATNEPNGGGTNPSPPKVNTLQVGELVKIEFTGGPQIIPPHAENIKEDGTITLDYIGSVKAAGRTTLDLQKEIHDKYVPKIYRNLNVTVRTDERFYFVGGEVKTPNREIYYGPITVTGAIKSAGDFTDFARKTQVKLIRADGKIEIIDCTKVLKGGSDPFVYPGDRIDVPRRGLFR